ncbi:MAG: hypothetical protein QW279_09085 [Candidatus Jordarchaeaceae archaeon]
MYEITETPDLEKFKDFSEKLEEILKEKEVPLLLQAVEFAKKEFGGQVSIRPELRVGRGRTVVIDIVVDRGKKKAASILDKLVQKVWAAFSEDITFIKVIDGVAGRGEVVDFIESLKSFGDESLRGFHENKEYSSEEFPYFPAQAAIIARDYSSTVFEEVEKLQRVEGKAYIPGVHVTWGARGKRFPVSSKCFIELWKWKQDYPERVFH